VIVMPDTMPDNIESSPLPADAWPALLDHYRRTAVTVLASHLQAGATCSACGEKWPCHPACAAELALEL
jgi:hypothetical protein